MKKASIIGGGVIGLSTGILLLQQGCKDVEIFAEKFVPHTNADAATAMWYPHISGMLDDQVLLYKRIAENSWDMFKSLESDKNFGISLKQNYEFFEKEEPLPYYQHLLPGFKAEHDPNFPNGLTYKWSFMTYIIEPPRYMPALSNWCQSMGGKFTEHKFSSKDEIQNLNTNVVFNCTGFGSKQLFGDKGLKPIKGQTLLHKKIEGVNSCIGLGDLCVVPREDGIILGCKNASNSQDTNVTEEDSELIWRELVEGFIAQGFGGVDTSNLKLAKENIIGGYAGTRPYRNGGIRLEAEQIGDKTIVHNYGHGGSGITLSWGSCMEAIILGKKGPSNKL